MNIVYQSTRGGQSGITASQAILQGLAEDGDYLMPNESPKLDVEPEKLSS